MQIVKTFYYCDLSKVTMKSLFLKHVLWEVKKFKCRMYIVVILLQLKNMMPFLVLQYKKSGVISTTFIMSHSNKII